MTGAALAAAEPLATHSAVTAIPFFVPTFAVVAVIAVIIWRDRRTPDDPRTGDPQAGEDHSEEGAGKAPHTPPVG